MLSSWSRNYFRAAVSGQYSHRCMMYLLLSVLQTTSLIRSLYITYQSMASTSNTTFWWALQKKTEWVIFQPTRTHHFDLQAQNFENSVFTFGCFSLKVVYNSCNLQRILQAAKFLIMYSFTPLQAPTYWNCHLHKRLLPDKLFQWWQYFLFSEYVLLMFYLLFWFHVKFKHSIQRH